MIQIQWGAYWMYSLYCLRFPRLRQFHDHILTFVKGALYNLILLEIVCKLTWIMICHHLGISARIKDWPIKPPCWVQALPVALTDINVPNSDKIIPWLIYVFYLSVNAHSLSTHPSYEFSTAYMYNILLWYCELWHILNANFTVHLTPNICSYYCHITWVIAYLVILLSHRGRVTHKCIHLRAALQRVPRVFPCIMYLKLSLLKSLLHLPGVDNLKHDPWAV